jgi:hypothetical protein
MSHDDHLRSDGGDASFDTSTFKDVMSRFATGVTIVAGIDDGEPVGFTCQSFVSLSLDPPYVTVAPAKTSSTWPRIARAGTFCVNVLADTQADLCMTFARSGSSQFAGVEWDQAPATGSPRIAGSLAWIDCAVSLVHDAGDHEIILGHVLALGVGDGSPLIFHQGRLATLSLDRAKG